MTVRDGRRMEIGGQVGGGARSVRAEGQVFTKAHFFFIQPQTHSRKTRQCVYMRLFTRKLVRTEDSCGVSFGFNVKHHKEISYIAKIS